MQAASGNLTDAQIAAMIAAKNADTSVKLFELLPQFIQNQDSDGIVRGFFEAVQEEYERSKSSITDIYAIIDPHNTGKNYTLSGNLVFFHPEQFIYGATADAPNTLVFNGPNPGVTGSGYYRDFGVFVWEDAAQPSSVGQYRIINAYDGLNRRAFLDESWTVIPSDTAVYALCWPDRVWLPVPVVSDPRKAGGTVFPRQQSISSDAYNLTNEQIQMALLLPGLSYLATIDDYYVGWTLEFLDGENAGRSVEVVGYRYRPEGRVIVLKQKVKQPAENDWFRITPPSFDQIGISDDYYKDRWIHIAAPSSSDVSYGTRIKAQSRQIIKSRLDVTTVPVSHVAYVYDPVTNSGQRFKSPPAPTVSYGISNSYIPLQYLAEYVGIELDDEDHEDYQREQISQAYNFHRLKGTRRALELVCRSFGLDVLIDEACSNYTHAPINGEVGPFAQANGKHTYYPSGQTTSHILAGNGIDDVPVGYLTQPGKDAARVPDSAIRIFFSRTNLNVAPFDSNMLYRILKKLSPHMPIHVQIVFVGLLTRIQEPVDVDAALTCQIRPLIQELTGVGETFLGTPIGKVPIEDSYATTTDLDVAIASPTRYSRMNARWGRLGAVPAIARWTLGSVVFVE